MDVPLAEDREFAMLDAEQINTLNAVERMGATLSLTGIILIFITFAIFKRLRTIPNTFIFFASIANIGACVACLIAYDGITAMSHDRSSPLCQAQGFIFEWFMQSDPWWSFAMAINVYMVFFMSFNPTTFRHYLWLYCLICYGLPAIPAFVFLFLRMPRGLIYGDAVLWCWIASQWNALRIYSYYLPIWICSVLSAVIYFAVGYHVFHQRNQLRNLSLSNQGIEVTGETSDVRDSAEKNLTSHPGPGYYGTVTTEVQVTSAEISPSSLPAYTNPFQTASSTRTNSHRRPSDQLALHIVTTGGSGESPRATPMPTPAPNAPGALCPVQPHNYPWSREPSSLSPHSDVESPTTTLVNNGNTSGFPATPSRPHLNNFETTNHGFSTTQYTSISADPPPRRDDRGPSPTRLLSPLSKGSTNEDRLHRDRNSGDRSGNPQGGSIFRRMSDGTRRFGARLKHMDPVKLAYLRTSFVFAISILVTWTPSSINRVYTLIYPERASYGLNIAAAVVLPLQGVWNAVIYFTTSWKIFLEEMEATRGGHAVLALLRINPYENAAERGGSFALASSSAGGGGGAGAAPRSEMGRSRRLGEGEGDGAVGPYDGGDGHGEGGVELRSPASTSPAPALRRPRPARMSTMRVTQKQLDDFN